MSRNSFNLFIFILTIFCFEIRAQSIVFTLPVVGDTINLDEKMKYLLFEEIPNNEYLFSIVSQKDNDTIITYYKKKDTLEVKTTRTFINSFLSNIAKLNSYYTYLENKEHNPSNNNSLYVNQNTSAETPSMKDKMDKALTTDPSVKVKKKDKKQDNNKFNTPEEKNRIKSIYYGGFE